MLTTAISAPRPGAKSPQAPEGRLARPEVRYIGFPAGFRQKEGDAGGGNPASNVRMKKIGQSFAVGLIPAVALGVMVMAGMAGCHSNQNPAQEQTPAGDPASANLAPASNVTETGTENPPPPPPDQTAQTSQTSQTQTPAAAPQAPEYASDQSAAPSGDYADYQDETPEAVAPQPPPPIPDYDQPEAPGDDYIWTPGYWAYAPNGYYWVPGAWVLAPYEGALWTPGYWGFYQSGYHWYPGYWGNHIGFYGGVNYGYGYFGNGYEGGYWRNNQFYYNRAVSHVGGGIHNTYDYRVDHPFNSSHVSYNGGNGGLNYRPDPREAAARNERHVAPLAAQRDLVRTAQQNRAQFAAENHGHPQMIAETRPVNGGRTAPAPRPEGMQLQPGRAGQSQGGRTEQQQGRPEQQRTHPQQQQNRAAANRETQNRQPQAEHTPPRQLPYQGMRPEPHPLPNPQTRQNPQERQPLQQQRPEQRTQPEQRQQPQQRPQAQPEARPQARPEQQQHTQARPESHAAPQHQEQPRPEQHPEDNHPH